MNNPSDCGISVPDKTLTFTQADLDSSHQQGVQKCVDNPSDCGIPVPDKTLTFTQADLDSSYQRGEQSCKIAGAVKIGTDLGFTVPNMLLPMADGSIMDIWAKFTFMDNGSENILFMLTDIGSN
ncbi:hypothetical protein [Thioflexithrix psekupsensis]|uniref:Uncharacterized protein n=1 Tax=Thioflexithrix psekupsensis TaxID=1570016 RepID=A0A251X3F9_9GAMM|nr:hypothetical protein [Thioflexithrix psekupsensis]OUD12033.1 hypothetical protein TPSD3_12920 [Thioflexithrix psekupsensis]